MTKILYKFEALVQTLQLSQSMSQMLASPDLTDPVAIAPQTTLEVSCCIALDHAAVSLPVLAKKVPEAGEGSNQPSSPSAKTEARPCQFEPLDLIEQSKEDKTFKETSTEQALVLCDGQAQIRISTALLEGIEFSLLPTKTVVAIKAMAKEYWEAYRSSESTCFDEEKALHFAFLLIAIYELKEHSLDELGEEREKTIYQLTEDELRKYAIKLNEKIIAQVSQQPSISWKQLLQDMANVENSWMRRKVLVLEDILEVYAVLKGKDQVGEKVAEEKTEESSVHADEKPATNEDIKPCHEAQPAAESQDGAPATQPTESGEEEKAHLIAILLKPNASLTEGSNEVSTHNENVVSVVNDERVDFDVIICISKDFSIETEGKVTEIDISLPLGQYNDESQRVEPLPEAENNS